MIVKIVELTVLFFLISCSTTKNQDITPTEDLVVKEPTEDLNLVITRLNARIDDLKQTIKTQEAKIKVLEKSILLGITPEEYLKEFNGKETENVQIASNVDVESTDIQSLKTVDDNINEEDLVVASDNGDESYSKHMLYAEEMYNSGNFGRAIVEYSDIIKRYPSKVDGEVYYWIGMCWYNLKEYRLSEESLTKFIQDFSNNKYVPDAKLIIALCYQGQGFSERAIKDLKEIIKQYPNHSVSKKAQQQITTIGKD